jgi:hypothetical protein
VVRYKSAGRKVLGKTEQLREQVYKIGTANQAEIFIKTTEAIADYMGAELSYKLMILVKHRKEANYTRPNPPEQAAAVKKTSAKADDPQAMSTAESTQLMQSVQSRARYLLPEAGQSTRTTKARLLWWVTAHGGV